MSETIIGIGITFLLFGLMVFALYKYAKKMKNKKIEVPHCGACGACKD